MCGEGEGDVWRGRGRYGRMRVMCERVRVCGRMRVIYRGVG